MPNTMMANNERTESGVGNSSFAMSVPTALYQVNPPEQFDFKAPNDWPRWLRRFERFRIASGLQSKTEEQQVNMLIYCMGEEGEDLLTSFNLSPADKVSYTAVKNKFDEYMGFKRNIVYERARFFKRKQESGEPVDSFINDLHKLAEYCQFGNLKEELIRDIIVIGVADTKLSECLQLDDSLTLSKAILKARQAENLQKQQPLIRDSTEIEAIGGAFSKDVKCFRCGYLRNHSHSVCPAASVKCFKCNQVGHFQKCCRQKKNKGKVREIEGKNDFVTGAELQYLRELTIDELKFQDSWVVRIKVKDQEIEFKLDTGADVSVISRSTADLLQLRLQPSDRALFGPNKTPLLVDGMCSVHLRYKDKSIVENLYVLPNQKVALLSRSAIMALNLIKVNIGNVEKQNWIAEFPEVFNGIGRMKGAYKIRLEETAVYFQASPLWYKFRARSVPKTNIPDN
ncbi:hypothetical protein O3M35_000829 [Rhynocoris fuscipes]|uniref:Uncharacterized protein n=1 Tax=Rhynocoris fuscipes TaxID=488301 RepID=A0AAW1DQT9_9HEMI